MTSQAPSPAEIPRLPRQEEMAEAPRAKRVPKAITTHGHTRQDPYFWLRDDAREDAEILAYLKEENDYRDLVLAPTKALQAELFEELKGRIKKDDQSVPVRLNQAWYYTRYAKGKEYPIHCRRVGAPDADEEIILDVNQLAEGHAYFAASGLCPSHDGKLLAYAEDTLSRRIYTIRVKDLERGETLDDALPNATTSIAWAGDNRTLFYVKRDPKTLRSRWVYRHVLGTSAEDDVLVHDEIDESFYVGVRTSKSKDFVFIELASTLVTETLALKASEPEGRFEPVVARQENHEYDVAHYKDRFYIRTNKGAQNFRLVSVPTTLAGDESQWEEVVPHRDDVLLDDIELFDEHLVLSERANALSQLRVIKWSDGSAHTIDMDDEVYVASLHQNPNLDTTVLRFAYSSPITPSSVYDYDLNTRTKTLRKQDEVLGGFDPSAYQTERRWAPARDGVMVPISLVYRRDSTLDGRHPLYVYGYGSYGYSIDPGFNASRLSLLDRGFIVAIAHIRGGQEMGRAWYDTGKMAHKMNTFRDFIDCTDYLIKEGYGRADRTVAAGGSAGGLLVGAVLNMRPDLYAAAHAAVPFVDVINTMLDESIPLTTNEFDEWGNPKQEDSYHTMLAYSPYDNVTEQRYPHLIVTTGLHDSQVQYWEPAKWVARLRHRKQDDHLLVLDTNLDTGHGGASGRFKRYEETARVYAFLLGVLQDKLPSS